MKSTIVRLGINLVTRRESVSNPNPYFLVRGRSYKEQSGVAPSSPYAAGATGADTCVDTTPLRLVSIAVDVSSIGISNTLSMM